MLRLAAGCLLVLLLQIAPASTTAQDLAARIDRYLATEVEKRGIPGLTAALVRDGKVIYAGAHGVAKRDESQRLTPRHVFHFASVSKPFVATAIMQLVERGKLNLDEPVTKVLPYFTLSDDHSRTITLRQMLTHTSGIPDVRDYEWNKPQFDEGAAERYVRAMARERLLWAPGSNWAYSNMAFDALADVIAKASGQSFEQFIRINILEPLGMKDSSFIYPEIDPALRTTGHVGNPSRISDVYPYNRRHAPSSTLNSNVIDMTRWMLANLNRGELDGHRILQVATHETLWTPKVQTSMRGGRIGLSWFVGEREGHRTIFHGGGDTGFRSYVLLLPDDAMGVVLASNWEGTPSDVLVNGIVDLVLTSAR